MERNVCSKLVFLHNMLLEKLLKGINKKEKVYNLIQCMLIYFVSMVFLYLAIFSTIKRMPLLNRWPALDTFYNIEDFKTTEWKRFIT